MKNTILFSCIALLVSLAGGKTYAQTVVGCDSVYTLAEQMPVFGAGEKDFFNYLNKNLEVKKPCKAADLKRLIMVINKDGKVSDIEVIGVNVKCKDDLIAQLKSFPDWKPGKDQGQPVCVKVIMPLQMKQHKQ